MSDRNRTIVTVVLLVVLLTVLAIVGYRNNWLNSQHWGEKVTELVTPAPTEPPAEPATIREGEPDPAISVPEGTADNPPEYDAETAEVKKLSGIDVQRFSTKEAAMWVWRGSPAFITGAKCPEGFVCTADAEVDGLRFIGLWDGPVSYDKLYAITLRRQAKYGKDDPVNTLTDCRLLVNENLNGTNEVPSFSVLAGNFKCSSADANVKSFLPASTTPSCPTTADAVSTLLTGSKDYASNFSPKDGFWYYKAGGPAVKMTLTFGHLLGWNGTNVDLTKPGDSAEAVTEATFYCSK